MAAGPDGNKMFTEVYFDLLLELRLEFVFWIHRGNIFDLMTKTKR